MEKDRLNPREFRWIIAAATVHPPVFFRSNFNNKVESAVFNAEDFLEMDIGGSLG
jgi:hypothetical protein